MAQLVASIDKIVDLKAELGGDTLQASLDKRVDLVASMDFRTDLLAEFGIGFKPFNGFYVVDRTGLQVIDKNSKKVIVL